MKEVKKLVIINLRTPDHYLFVSVNTGHLEF